MSNINPVITNAATFPKRVRKMHLNQATIVPYSDGSPVIPAKAGNQFSHQHTKWWDFHPRIMQRIRPTKERKSRKGVCQTQHDRMNDKILTVKTQPSEIRHQAINQPSGATSGIVKTYKRLMVLMTLTVKFDLYFLKKMKGLGNLGMFLFQTATMNRTRR